VYETPELYRLVLGFGSDVSVAKPTKIKKGDGGRSEET
jgi:hypothetical protein